MNWWENPAQIERIRNDLARKPASEQALRSHTQTANAGRGVEDHDMTVAVVLTAIQTETEAVLRHLADRSRTRVADTWFQTGRFDRWTVAVAEVGPGNAPAATIAVRAFTHFKPEIAAFVGVAGGVKDVALGDVVVATKVCGYESGKETLEGFEIRADVQPSHHELQQRARVLRTDTSWHKRLDSTQWSARKPAVYVAPIAAGEAVVATYKGRISARLKQNYGDALAVEMEGRGFLQAAHIDSGCRAVVVRGISDLLKGKASADKQGWQKRAADAAAAFFFEMLSLESNRDDASNIRRPTIQSDQKPDARAALDQVRQFHIERVKTIAGSAPQVPLLDGPILVMHLAPLQTFDVPQHAPFAEICSNPRNFLPIRDTAPRVWRINFEGLITSSNSEGLGKPQRAYVYVSPSGALESVISSIALGRSHSFLQLPEIQSMIIHYARVYAGTLDKFGIHPPLAVFVSLARTKNMRLLQDFIGNATPVDIPFGFLKDDTLHFREAIFETIPQNDVISAKMPAPILNHLANAAGLGTPPYFDADGNYTLKVAIPAG
jgi:nucleoside phosphorylase